MYPSMHWPPRLYSGEDFAQSRDPKLNLRDRSCGFGYQLLWWLKSGRTEPLVDLRSGSGLPRSPEVQLSLLPWGALASQSFIPAGLFGQALLKGPLVLDAGTLDQHRSLLQRESIGR